MQLNPTIHKLLAALRRAGHACDISAISAGHAGHGIRIYLADHMQHAARLADALHDVLGLVGGPHAAAPPSRR